MTPATSSAPLLPIGDAALRVPTIAGEGSPASLAPRLTVVIHGDPLAQGRGKAAAWKAKDGRSGIAVRDPKKSRDWKARAAALILAELEKLGDGYPIPLLPAGPIAMLIEAVFPFPVSQARRHPLPRAWHVTNRRHDWDNVAKAICDAATGLLWTDDGQVVDVQFRKIRAAQDEASFVRITVSAAGSL